MKPIEVKEIVKDHKWMTLTQGQYIYDFLIKNNCTNVLELGFLHGVSSLYIAGAMQDNGGKLTTIDHKSARKRNPNIETLLKNANLESYVNYYYEPKSYTWRMMRFLQEGKVGTFDFVYIDGSHTWDGAGYDFYLASKLLKKNGWILFDDILLTYENTQPNWKSKMPNDMFVLPQVGLVYDLLVKTDDRYSNFFSPSEVPNWGFAQKII